MPDGIASHSNGHTETQVARVAVRPPPFWKSNPSLWFAQIEAQFNISGITEDSTKFNHVVAAVESDILNSVHDLILKPPEKDKYSTLKKRLIEIHSESESSKIRTLLQGLELGDQRPSYLLTRMRELAGSHFSDDLLKSLWLTRLPNNIQIILAASNEDLSRLAEMADKIIELVTPSYIHEANANISQTSTISLERQVADLTQQIHELRTSLRDSKNNRSYSRNRSRDRKRSHSRNRPYKEPRDGLCFYHTNFGPKAQKCNRPCSYQEN